MYSSTTAWCWRALHRKPVPIETAVDGVERLLMAQEGGKGTILWGFSFCETLVVKIALHRAGVQLIQLSTVGHGVPSPPSEFGMRFVGPLFCKAENRFLAERVSIPADQSLGYLRFSVSRTARGRTPSEVLSMRGIAHWSNRRGKSAVARYPRESRVSFR